MSYEYGGTDLPEKAKASRSQFFIGHGLSSWRGGRYGKVSYGKLGRRVRHTLSTRGQSDDDADGKDARIELHGRLYPEVTEEGACQLAVRR